jgi:RNA polymerase sigma-70 factor (ECF subfamily)
LAGVPADASFSEAAEQLQMSAGAARVAVHRLRRQYRDLLRDEIGQTVSSAEEIDDEIRGLFIVLG